ncbi:VanW family protein [Alicyclobacillus sp. SO9]|uniref:VanW family protein n=1 Tax=Alicyclobacillus sp. SO9 TaxID=2665646 RepID=UPI0018E8A03F|nr:VanW family protein [Alicyclobacillus sp. SO9]QQE81006.1 VanW family protein [Alicyclobacillus sp. SO9]
MNWTKKLQLGALASIYLVTPSAMAEHTPHRGGAPAHPVRLIEPKTAKGSEVPAPLSPTVPPFGKEDAKKHGLSYLLSQRTTNYYHASDSQAKNMDLLAKRLNNTLVKPGQVFSYYKTVGPYTAQNGFHWGRAFQGDKIVPSMGGGVCQGASTLYSALLRTNLQIVERHQHSLTVPYLPPGEDATVASTYLNFRFKNTDKKPVLITAKTDAEKKWLTVAVWGAHEPQRITVRHKTLKVYPYPTKVRNNPKLPAGTTKLLFPGQSGVKVDTWVELSTPSGVQKRDIGIDTYRPSPRIYETNAKHTD